VFEPAVLSVIFSLPVVDFEPVQLPEAVHDVALVDDQVIVNSSPVGTELDDGLIVTVGAGVTGGGVTGAVSPPPPPPPPHEDTINRMAKNFKYFIS
jgi:hypothetical protein